jgi:hypothetical protein
LASSPGEGVLGERALQSLRSLQFLLVDGEDPEELGGEELVELHDEELEPLASDFLRQLGGEEDIEEDGDGREGGEVEIAGSLKPRACFSLQEDLMAGGTYLVRIGSAEGGELESLVV